MGLDFYTTAGVNCKWEDVNLVQQQIILGAKQTLEEPHFSPAPSACCVIRMSLGGT